MTWYCILIVYQQKEMLVLSITVFVQYSSGKLLWAIWAAEKHSPCSTGIQSFVKDRLDSFTGKVTQGVRKWDSGALQTWQERGSPNTLSASCLSLLSEMDKAVTACIIAVSNVYWQQISHRSLSSLGTDPQCSLEQTLRARALCHEFHWVNTKEFPPSIENLQLLGLSGANPTHHPCGWARIKTVMCIEQIICIKRCFQTVSVDQKGRHRSL